MSEERRSLPPAHSRVSLATLTGSTHVNLLGNVHGGEIMKLVDSTAGAVAARHSGGPAVTAFMDEMAFLAPVHVGDIIRTLAQVNWVGTSSMEIGVRVEAQPWGSAADEPLHVASAYVVFVAIDAEGPHAADQPAGEPDSARASAGRRPRPAVAAGPRSSPAAPRCRRSLRRVVTAVTGVTGDTWRHVASFPEHREAPSRMPRSAPGRPEGRPEGPPSGAARRLPDERAARVRFRRAVALMVMTLVAPGSAQLVAGNREVGRVALRVWLSLVVVGTVTWLPRCSDHRVRLLGRLQPTLLGCVRLVLIALALGWAFLFVDAWRIGQPLSLSSSTAARWSRSTGCSASGWPGRCSSAPTWSRSSVT